MSELQVINYNEIICSPLASDTHLIINKKLLLLLELEVAVLLSELLSKESNSIIKEQTENGWFCASQNNVNCNTDLSPYKQKKATDRLIELNILKSKRAGVHGKKWYKINHKKVFNLFFNISIKQNALTYGE